MKDLKSVEVNSIEVLENTKFEFVLIKKNLKNNKVQTLSNEVNENLFQKLFPISFSKYEKIILAELEILHTLNLTDPIIVDFCQFVNMQLISNESLIQCPQCLGKRKTTSESKTFKEELIYSYQNSRGYPIFVHPVDFRLLLDSYKNIENMPKTVEFRLTKTKKCTKGNFNHESWSLFSHLGKNCEIVLVNVELSSIVSTFDKNKYDHMMKIFDQENNVMNVKKPFRFRKKSNEFSIEDDSMDYLKIHIKKRYQNSKMNHHKDNRGAQKLESQKI